MSNAANALPITRNVPDPDCHLSAASLQTGQAGGAGHGK